MQHVLSSANFQSHDDELHGRFYALI